MELELNTNQELVDIDCKNTKRKRIFEIDFLRGLCIILMVIDHLFWSIYDLVWRFFDTGVIKANNILYNYPNANGYYVPDALFKYMLAGDWYYNLPLRGAIRLTVLFIFFFISGISFTFSKNNLKRGLMLLGVGIGISVVTYVLAYLGIISFSIFIPFGVISCYGALVLLTLGIEKLHKLFHNLFYKNKNIDENKKDSNYFKVSIILILIFLFLSILAYFLLEEYGYTFTITNFKDPYELFIDIVANIFGFAAISGDYFPLFPYLTYFLIGILIGKTVYKNKESLFNYDPSIYSIKRIKKGENINYPKTILTNIFINPFCFVGRHTIWVYLFHIPVITVFHSILFLCSGFNLEI